MHFDFRPLFRITFAELSRKYPYSQTPAISRGCTEGKAKTRGLGVWLSQSVTFGNLATATRILWCPFPAGPRAAVGGSPLHIMIIILYIRKFVRFSTWRSEMHSTGYTAFSRKKCQASCHTASGQQDSPPARFTYCVPSQALEALWSMTHVTGGPACVEISLYFGMAW